MICSIMATLTCMYYYHIRYSITPRITFVIIPVTGRCFSCIAFHLFPTLYSNSNPTNLRSHPLSITSQYLEKAYGNRNCEKMSSKGAILIMVKDFHFRKTHKPLIYLVGVSVEIKLKTPLWTTPTSTHTLDATPHHTLSGPHT